jgi:2-haloacid dehalogenase
MKYKYRLMFFDADETLFDYGASEKEALKIAYKEMCDTDKHNFDLFHQKYKLINEALWEQYHKGQIEKEELIERRFQILFSEFNLSISAKKFGDRYVHHLSNSSILIPYAEEVTAQLSQHCKLVIITNGISLVHRTRLKQSPLATIITDIFLSGDHKENPDFRKPKAYIFEIAHRLVDTTIPKEKIFMV